MYKILLCLFIFFPLSTRAEFQYAFRDIHQPIFTLPDNVRIIQYSPRRTGSTWVFNILHYLFEDTLSEHTSINKKVIKDHAADKYYTLISQNYDVFCICSIRHPLDVLASKLMFFNKGIFTDYQIFYHLYETIVEFEILYEFIQLIPQERVLMLRYEEILQDEELIFIGIEDLFSITISEECKKNIMCYFNREEIKKQSGQFNDFESCDPITGVHGQHINEVAWREIFPKEYHGLLLFYVRDILMKWDYPLM